MEPQPSEVAATLAQLCRDEWPRSIDDATPWLTSLGIDAAAPATSWGDSDRGAWDFAAVPSWGERARGGWSSYQGRLAGVSWWLWEGDEPDTVQTAATQLADEISRLLRDPTDVSGPSRGAFGTWHWRLDAHSIDMYVHAKEFLPGMPDTYTDAMVQLSIDLREVADPRNAEDRRRHGARTVPADEVDTWSDDLHQ